MPNSDSEGWLLSAHQIHAKLAARDRGEAVPIARVVVEEHAVVAKVATAVVAAAVKAAAASASTRMSTPTTAVAVEAVVEAAAMEVVEPAAAMEVAKTALTPAVKDQDAHALSSLAVRIHSFSAQMPVAAAAENIIIY